jgi:rhomboid protease GluP
LLRFAANIPATATLVALNVLIHLAANGVPRWHRVFMLLGDNHGPAFFFGGHWWRPISAAFLHGGTLHLVMNMLSLVQVGLVLERLWGWKVMLTLYFGSALIAALATMYWSPLIHSIGASGAVFGTFGALLVLASRMRRIWPQAMGRLRVILAWLIGYNLLLGALLPQIDHAAHVGGLLAGMLGASLIRIDATHPDRLKPTAGSIALVAAVYCIVIVWAMPYAGAEVRQAALGVLGSP